MNRFQREFDALRPIGDDLNPDDYKVVRAPKVCRSCGKTWIGNTFKKQKARPVLAFCDECIDRRNLP